MGKSLTLAVIGGDERQVFLASLALADGHAVRTFALDRANIEGAAICSDAASCTEGADAVLLPVPVMQGDGLLRAPLARTETDVMQVLDAIPAGVPAFGGAVPFRLHARAVQCGVRYATPCLPVRERCSSLWSRLTARYRVHMCSSLVQDGSDFCLLSDCMHWEHR